MRWFVPETSRSHLWELWEELHSLTLDRSKAMLPDGEHTLGAWLPLRFWWDPHCSWMSLLLLVPEVVCHFHLYLFVCVLKIHVIGSMHSKQLHWWKRWLRNVEIFSDLWTTPRQPDGTGLDVNLETSMQVHSHHCFPCQDFSDTGIIHLWVQAPRDSKAEKEWEQFGSLLSAV